MMSHLIKIYAVCKFSYFVSGTKRGKYSLNTCSLGQASPRECTLILLYQTTAV